MVTRKHAAPDPFPTALADIPDEAVVEVDVREDLRAGREPFRRIMTAREQLPEGGALCVRAIFEPAPLFAVMARHGLAHHSRQRGPEDWEVWFYPDTVPAREPEPRQEDDAATSEDDVVVLDVRGLEPPEPMVRTLAALESLPPDGTLVQINVRVPRFLLPELEVRGFTYQVREQAEGQVHVFIRRSDEAEG